MFPAGQVRPQPPVRAGLLTTEISNMAVQRGAPPVRRCGLGCLPVASGAWFIDNDQSMERSGHT